MTYISPPKRAHYTRTTFVFFNALSMYYKCTIILVNSKTCFIFIQLTNWYNRRECFLFMIIIYNVSFNINSFANYSITFVLHIFMKCLVTKTLNYTIPSLSMMMNIWNSSARSGMIGNSIFQVSTCSWAIMHHQAWNWCRMWFWRMMGSGGRRMSWRASMMMVLIVS